MKVLVITHSEFTSNNVLMNYKSIKELEWKK